MAPKERRFRRSRTAPRVKVAGVQLDKFASWFRAETGLQRDEKRAKENVSLHDINHLKVQILPAIRPVGNEQIIDRDAPSSGALSALFSR